MTLAAGAAFWLAWAAAAEAAAPKPSRATRLHVSVQADNLSPGSGGGGGGLALTRSLSPRTFLQAGGFLYSLGGSRWGYGQAAVVLSPGARTTLMAQADVGRGRREGRGFPYAVLKANVTQQVTPGGFAVEVEDQYVSVEDARGNIVKLGTVISRRALSARVAVHRSIGGNVGARYVSGRVDLTRGARGVLGGLSIGRSRPEIFNVFSIGGTVHSTEVFVGTRFSLGRRDVTFVVDHVWVAGTRRATAILGLGLPL